jgi:hypothetical protein
VKGLKNALRVWITLVSIVGFAASWMTLAHSRKPLQPQQTTNAVSLEPLPALPTIGSFDNGNFGVQGLGQGQQLFLRRSQRSNSMPLFSTGGS